MELIELVEIETTDLLNKKVVDVYEVYSGDWVSLIMDSANAYWHTFDKWKEKYSTYYIIDRRFIMVLSSGRYVGHWTSKELFYEFVQYNLRGTVLETVVP